MPDPAFAQPERRSYLVPILLALVAIGVALAIARHYFPATTINIAHVRTELLPTTTVFKSESTVVGMSQTQNVLFIATTLRVENQMRVPIFLDNFQLTYANPKDEQLEAKALTKDELANAELNFPALKAMARSPLLRDTTIDPGKTAEGTVVFTLQIPKSMWDKRKIATIKVDIYHQYPVYQDIPK